MRKRISSILVILAVFFQTATLLSPSASAWAWATDGKYEVASYNAVIVSTGSVSVDAKLDHAYLAATKITEYPEISPYTRSGYSSVYGDAKGNFSAYVAADTKGMYIYAEIVDSTIFETVNTNGNDGDYLSIYFDWVDSHPTPDERTDSWVAKDYLSTYGSNQNLGWLSADYHGNIVGSRGFSNYSNLGPNKNQSVVYKSRLTDDGWACEWFIPWKDQTQINAITRGKQIPCGIGFQVGDDSDINNTATVDKEQDVVIRFDQRQEMGLSYYLDYSMLSDLNFVKGPETTYSICTTTKLADKICTACGEIIKENVSITSSAAGTESHVYVLSSESTEPTCDKEGREIYECKYCDKTYENVTEALGHSYGFNKREARHICTTCRARNDHGDVNGDGEITNADVLSVFRYIFDPEENPLSSTAVTDVNGDGEITNADILILFKYIFDSRLYPIVERLPEILVDGRNLSDYVIVYPEDNALGEKKLAEELAAGIMAKHGLELEIYADSVETFEYEIIIGRAERDESDSIYSKAFEYDQFTVSVSDKKIAVGFADNKFALMKAVAELEIMVTKTGTIKTVSKRAVPEKLLNSACFSDTHNTFTMLEPTNSTGNYVFRKTHDRAIELIKEKYGLLDIVVVGGDLMSDYPRWDVSGWWPYKYYVEYKQLIVNKFASLAKDGKVIYVAGNHDYAQGEVATDGPGKGGSYNSSEFYFTGPMNTTMGVLDDKDMHMITGTHTGEKYLLGYHYEVNGVHFMGLAPDPDHEGIWSKQGYGFNPDTLKWFKETLERIDPDGDEIIFVNCHFHMAHRVNDVIKGGQADKDILPIIKGHSNLFWLFGHVHTGTQDIAQSHTSEMVVHYDKNGNTIETPAIASSYGNASDRGPSTVYMGAGRIDYDSRYFGLDKIYGYGGYTSNTNTYNSTATPTICQVMYFTVYEDRVEFQSINVGTHAGYTEKDIIEPYTVYFYK